MAEDVHTERLLVTVFRFLHMLPCCKYSKGSLYTPEYYVEVLTRDMFLYASHKTYTGLVSR